MEDKFNIRNHRIQIILANSEGEIKFLNEDYVIRESHIGEIGYSGGLCQLNNGDIAAGKANGEIDIFYKHSAQLRVTFRVYPYCINTLTELNSGELICGSRDGSLKLWNNLEYKPTCIREFISHKGDVFCVFQHSSGVIISGSLDQKVHIWNPINGNLIKSILHVSTISQLQELASGRILSICRSIFGPTAISLKIWDLVSGLTIYNTSSHIEPSGLYVAYLINLQLVLLGGVWGHLLVFNLEKKIFINNYKLHEQVILQIQRLNQDQIFTVSDDKTMKISNWETREIICTIQQDIGKVMSIIIVDDENLEQSNYLVEYFK